MKHIRPIIRFVAIGFFALLILLILSSLAKIGVPKKANADSLDAYPNGCLGGWQNPSNASGPQDVPVGGDTFTGNNSAVLNQAQAQIFCGSFQASDESQTPTAVTLHFSWNVIFASQASNATSSDADNAEWSSVLDATSTATSSASTTDDASDTSSTVSTTPTSTVASSSDSQEQGTGSSGTSTDSSTTPPTSDPSNSDTSSTSFLHTIFSNPLSLLVQKTFADSTGNDSSTIDTSTITDASSVTTANNFIDVSYSLDGTTWIDLGPVSESNWQNFSVTIPVSSWSDINKIQIQLSPLITPDEPTIYLDAMWLQVDYNNSILTDIQNAIADLLPTDTLSTSTPLQDTTNPNPAPVETLAPVPPPIPQHQYVFTLQGAQSIKGGKLDWYPENSGSSSASSAPTGAPTVSLPATDTIQVSGTCSAAYYTILIFPDANDYESNPSLALYNSANKCVNGSFAQTITDMDLPPQLASGTYYLVVANQGVKGPWIPYPETYPIVLGSAPSGTSTSQ